MQKILAVLALGLFVFGARGHAQTNRAEQAQETNGQQLQSQPGQHVHADVQVISTPAKDRYDKAAVWINFGLGIVGLLGIVVALLTLRKIKIQADEMRLQRVALETQAKDARESAAAATLVAQGTLDALTKQAAVMEFQAQQMVNQTFHLQSSVTAAQSSADAAQTSANALVSSERAWVQVEVLGDPDWVETPGGSSKIWFRPLLKNFGRTPATVELMSVRPHLMPRDENFPEPPLLPAEPEYASSQTAFTDRHGFLPPIMGITPLAVAITAAEFEAMRKRELFLYIYGQIFYRDISGEGRESRFCNLYWIPPDESHPAPEGFMTSGNTPHAYTECN